MLAAVPPAGPTGFVVLRSSGHAGSRWLSELLATQNLTFLFEFAGHCSERYGATSKLSMHDIFRTACACRLDAAMESVCASDEDGRIHSMSCVKDAFCDQRCPRRPPGGCLAVGMVDSYQPAMVQRLAAARTQRPFAIATFERDNAVKHAISKLRASCGGTNLKGNHMKKPTRSEAAAVAVGGGGGALAGPLAPPGAPRRPSSHADAEEESADISLMHIDPRLLLAEATQSLLGRRLMHEGVRRAFGSASYALHYEELQLSPAEALRPLLAAVGVGGLDEHALARSALVKGASDSLRSTLLNFGELHGAFARAPCLQRMLGASTPQRFAADCASGGADAEAAVHHQAKQDTHTRVLWCRNASPARASSTSPSVGASAAAEPPPLSPSCAVASMNTAAALEAAALARAEGFKGRRHARINGISKPLPPPVRRRRRMSAVASSGHANSSRWSAADRAALIAGECVAEEMHMCERALARAAAANDRGRRSISDSPSSSGAQTAEICVLREVPG